MPLITGQWSLDELVPRIDLSLLKMPAFQRRYVWTSDKALALFDSIFRGIPTGSITLAVPTFAIAVAGVDTRNDSEVGTTQDFHPFEVDQFQALTTEAQKVSREYKCLLVLDGQQRITTIYRVLTGIDPLYVTIAATIQSIGSLSAVANSNMTVSEEESADLLSIRISDAYSSGTKTDSELITAFQNSTYRRKLVDTGQSDRIALEETRYLKLTRALGDLVRRERCVNYIESDASESDLITFFERSNQQGVRLSFIDLLNAKTFTSFTPRLGRSFSEAMKKLEKYDKKYDDRYRIQSREDNFIRILCLEALEQQRSDGETPISKTFILKKIRGEDIVDKFYAYVDDWPKALDYLFDLKLVSPRDSMPFPLMVIPTFFFLKSFGFNRQKIKKSQANFFVWWYWASVFSRRYSFQTNEAAYRDVCLLRKIASWKVDDIAEEDFSGFRPNLQSADDVMNLSGRGGHFQRAIASLSVFQNDAKCIFSGEALATLPAPNKLEKFDYHHIFPKDYLGKIGYSGRYRDSIANLMLATSLQRSTVLSRSPSEYLSKLEELGSYPEGLKSHFVSAEMYGDLVSGRFDNQFDLFVERRAELMFSAIQKVAGVVSGKEVLRQVKNDAR